MSVTGKCDVISNPQTLSIRCKSSSAWAAFITVMSDSASNQGPEGKELDYASLAVQGHANLTYSYGQADRQLLMLQRHTQLSITYFIRERMRKYFAACRIYINSLYLQQLYTLSCIWH